MSKSAKDDLYLAWLRGRSGMRRVGLVLFVLGVLVGGFGWFVLMMELSTGPNHLGLAIFLAAVGTLLSNLGFSLMMFGFLEDRIYQSEAVVLAEIKQARPEG